MGRDVKRVPVDFGWPLNEIWEGYLTPDRLQGETCRSCNGSGQTHFGWWLHYFCYEIAMLASDVHKQDRGRPMHPWLAEFSQAHGHFEYSDVGEWKRDYEVRDRERLRGMRSRFVLDRPGRDALSFVHGIIRRAYEIRHAEGGEYAQYYTPDDVPAVEDCGSSIGISSAGTGVGNIQSALMTVLQDAAGCSLACEDCGGEGEHERYEGQRAERRAWEPYEPPTGEGWQLWETVSEGSPISPVFDSAEGLARWLSEDATRDNPKWYRDSSDLMSYEAALRFIGVGWAPTLIGTSATGVVSGEKYVGEHGAGGG